MQKKFTFILAIAALFLTSCGLQNGLTSNLNSHNTQVILSQKNFTVVDHVEASKSITYIFGIGGTSKKALIAEARKEMLSKVNIVGKSRAIINETVEIKGTFFVFVNKFEVTVSGHVVEFTE